ncbi:MAG: hypothetical protein AB7U98_07045 [Candidatus Nitrosocosmicus sp.]
MAKNSTNCYKSKRRRGNQWNHGNYTTSFLDKPISNHINCVYSRPEILNFNGSRKQQE